MVTRRGFGTLWCCRRPAGGKRHPTGVSHFVIRIPWRKKEQILDGDPDLAGIAAAYGMDFLKLYKGTDTDKIISEFLKYPERSTILECDVDPANLA